MEDNQILINRIKNSGFSEEQKGRLIFLLPSMNEAQKKQMLILIGKSNQVTQMKADYREKLGKINTEHLQKIKDKKRELTHYAQQQFQKVDEQKSEQELENLEIELNTL